MRAAWVATAVALMGLGCVTGKQPARTAGAPGRELRFEEQLIEGDLALEGLNDQELFACGASAQAAGEHQRAARCFGRLADFHPGSRQLRAALYRAGLAHQKLSQWEEAHARFALLADPAGSGAALDAAFRLAECEYHLGRYAEAAALLSRIEGRSDLPESTRLEAQVQQGICEHEMGESNRAEATLRAALERFSRLEDKDENAERFAGQGQFFLGELYRLRFEQVTLDPQKDSDALAADLELKAQLLLSAQGHYLRAIRIGNGYWATAAGGQIGGLYENLYEQLMNSPAPRELDAEQAQVYREEVRDRLRVLLTKAIGIYERTLEAAERIGSSSPFVDKTRERLKRMKDLLVADSQSEESELPPPPAQPRPRS